MQAGALRAYLLLLDQSVDMKSTATNGLVGNAIFLRGEKITLLFGGGWRPS